MAVTFSHFSQLKPLSNVVKISCCSQIHETKPNTVKQIQAKKRCLRCNTLYLEKDNSPTACSFHGHITGEKGLYSLAPPHQGIDGEWSDRSGVIVYKWNEKGNRPNTGRANWKKRWSCCSEYDENAPPCRLGWHVSYDDGCSTCRISIFLRLKPCGLSCDCKVQRREWQLLEQQIVALTNAFWSSGVHKVNSWVTT